MTTLPNYGALAPGYYDDEELALQNATSDLTGFDKGLIKNTIFNISPKLSEYMPSLPSTNDISSFGSWLIGNKDFSPLGTFNALLGTGFDFLQHKDNYKLARDTLNEQMAMARANLGTSIGNALGSRADKAQLMSGWSQKAGSDYVNHSQDIADGLIQLASNAGVDTSAMKNYKNAIEQYNLLGH